MRTLGFFLLFVGFALGQNQVATTAKAGRNTGRGTTQEATISLLIKNAKESCGARLRRDPEYFRLPPPGEQLVYVLNGKEHSQKSLLEGAKQSTMLNCSTDQIEVTLPGVFPSTAIVTERVQHEGIYSGTRGKVKVFSVYARYTYEYTDSRWILRKLEAVNAK